MIKLDIYSGYWDETGESFEYLNFYFQELQQFYIKAAKNKEAIVTFVS